ncbi:MAG: GYD domain-containing protein [Xanthomonadales bacterium]|nr:GYD domain-containing protein [Xanthomonadales bacterium]
MSRRYLVVGKYTAAGFTGVVKDGFQSRVDNLQAAVESLGGKLIEYSFCSGTEYDFIALYEIADENKALTIQLVAGASGTISTSTIRLLTASEMDANRSNIAGVKWTPAGK